MRRQMSQVGNRVAVIGAGVSGMSAAWHLQQLQSSHASHVTLYEAQSRLGGHANTVDVTMPDTKGALLTHGVDTGFLVYNERTYPGLIALFKQLDVPTAKSEMSFSVQVPKMPDSKAIARAQRWMAGLVWGGSDLSTLFAQRRLLLSPPFWRMLADILRFNRLTTAMALRQDDAGMQASVAVFLEKHRFSAAFRDAYLLPMVACIWSCPVSQMMAFPIGTLIRFCHNHGLLQVSDRPQWFTVQGGSREYVTRLAQSIEQAGGRIHVAMPVQSVVRSQAGQVGVVTAAGVEWFDNVIMACHTDQALALLGAHALADEQAVLGAIAYQANRAVLHTDTTLMPSEQKVWSAWNYERAALDAHDPGAVCLHYWLNRLQPLPWPQPVFVSLNPLREPRTETVIQRFEYAHPVFDLKALQAQQQLPRIQGQHGVWFCGAWARYGFHEDGWQSGLAVAHSMAQKVVSTVTPKALAA